MKKRGFEIVTKYQEAGLSLPVRSTAHSAGYDFACAEDFVLPSIWHYNFVRLFRMIRNGKPLVDDDFERASKTLKPFLVPTGIKAYMQDDEYLMIANRSSNPLKKGLILPNGVGIAGISSINAAAASALSMRITTAMMPTKVKFLSKWLTSVRGMLS